MMQEISMVCELTWLHLTPGGSPAARISARYVDVASGEIHCQSEPDGTTPDDQNVR